MFSWRGSTWFTIFFWLASMSWLGWTQLRPALRRARPPQQQDILPMEAVRLPPIHWRIFLNDRVLGWASHDVERMEDGQGRVDSTVRIENLSADQVLQQGLGTLGRLLSRGLNGQEGLRLTPVRLTVHSSMHFDHYGQLESFSSVVTEDDWGECIQIFGAVRDARLLVKAYLVLGEPDEQLTREPVYQTVLPLPDDAMVVDSLAPYPRLANLQVGQRWTFQSYHPLLPNRPLQTIEAVVKERRVLRIDGQDVWTFRVAYLRGADDGLSLDRHLGDVYVQDDGTVIRQTLKWGRMNVRFDRLPQDADPASSVTPRVKELPAEDGSRVDALRSGV